MTSPVEFPMYGKFKKTELSKENLLAFWDMVLNRADFNVVTGEKVEDIKKGDDGIFTVMTREQPVSRTRRDSGAWARRNSAESSASRARNCPR